MPFASLGQGPAAVLCVYRCTPVEVQREELGLLSAQNLCSHTKMPCWEGLPSKDLHLNLHIPHSSSSYEFEAPSSTDFKLIMLFKCYPCHTKLLLTPNFEAAGINSHDFLEI